VTLPEISRKIGVFLLVIHPNDGMPENQSHFPADSQVCRAAKSPIARRAVPDLALINDVYNHCSCSAPSDRAASD
jgi:hypothetical protein